VGWAGGSFGGGGGGKRGADDGCALFANAGGSWAGLIGVKGGSLNTFELLALLPTKPRGLGIAE
jgi:hypothetical protein